MRTIRYQAHESSRQSGTCCLITFLILQAANRPKSPLHVARPSKVSFPFKGHTPGLSLPSLMLHTCYTTQARSYLRHLESGKLKTEAGTPAQAQYRGAGDD